MAMLQELKVGAIVAKLKKHEDAQVVERAKVVDVAPAATTPR